MTYEAEALRRFLGDPARVVRLVVADAVEEVVLVVAVEGRLTDHHLVEQHAEAPPVHRAVVLLALQNLLANKHSTYTNTCACTRLANSYNTSVLRQKDALQLGITSIKQQLKTAF